MLVILGLASYSRLASCSRASRFPVVLAFLVFLVILGFLGFLGKASSLTLYCPLLLTPSSFLLTTFAFLLSTYYFLLPPFVNY